MVGDFFRVGHQYWLIVLKRISEGSVEYICFRNGERRRFRPRDGVVTRFGWER